MAVVRIYDYGRAATYRPKRLLGNRLDFRINRQVHIRARSGRDFAKHAIDLAFRVPPHVTDPRFALQVFVHRLFDVGFSLHVGLVKRELLRVFLVRVVGRTNITEQVGREGAVNIGADRLDRDVDTGQPDVVFGELRHRLEVDVL